MKEPKSVHPESIASFGQGTPADEKPADNQVAAPPWLRIVLPGALAVALLAVALVLRGLPAAPAPMAVATTAPTAAPAPTAPPAPATIALGWSPGDRSAPVPADATFARLGPVELVNGETECFVEVRYGDQVARLWGPCAALGFPDAPKPTPVPTSPPPAPVYQPAPQAAPAAPQAAPADLVPLPTESPFGAKPKPDRGRP